MDARLIEIAAAGIRTLHRQGGIEALRDKRRIQGILADRLPDQHSLRAAVLEALAIEIPGRLAETSSELVGAAISREADRLRAVTGIESELACLAVIIWARALGHQAEMSMSQQNPTAARPSTQTSALAKLVAALVVGIGVYFAFFRPAPTPNPAPPASKTAAPGAQPAPTPASPSPRPAANPAPSSASALTWPIGPHTAILEYSPVYGCPEGWSYGPFSESTNWVAGLPCLRATSTMLHLKATSRRHSIPDTTPILLVIDDKLAPCAPSALYENAEVCLLPVSSPLGKDAELSITARPPPSSGCVAAGLMLTPLAAACLDHPQNPALGEGWQSTQEGEAFARDIKTPTSLFIHDRNHAPQFLPPVADWRAAQCPPHTVLQNHDYCLIRP